MKEKIFFRKLNFLKKVGYRDDEKIIELAPKISKKLNEALGKRLLKKFNICYNIKEDAKIEIKSRKELEDMFRLINNFCIMNDIKLK